MSDVSEPIKPVAPPSAAPPKEGDLTPEQLQQAKEWLRTHWSNGNCPFHLGRTNWIVDNSLAAAPIYHIGPGGIGGTMMIGGPMFPLAVVTCSVCGHTVFVNAILMGLVKPDASVPSSDKSDT